MPRLEGEALQSLAAQVPDWEVVQDRELKRRYEFADFVALMKYVSSLAELAENEGHHPDFSVHYNKLDVTLWTHAIGGLSENDFILAAKLEELPR
ncbi:MAG: 4a-hydroxytetrahydrobiopterin dehydratase [Acidobacteriota bacterium]